MSDPRDTTTTPADPAESAPAGLIVLGTADGAADADAGECADGFCAL
ncbi:hypothetical protein [Jiangella aurantiaca]|nr:hypothetical protein [Jiangella aurantiaca]